MFRLLSMSYVERLTHLDINKGKKSLPTGKALDFNKAACEQLLLQTNGFSGIHIAMSVVFVFPRLA